MGAKVKVVLRRGDAFFTFFIIFFTSGILRNKRCLTPAVFVASTCLSRPIDAPQKHILPSPRYVNRPQPPPALATLPTFQPESTDHAPPCSTLCFPSPLHQSDSDAFRPSPRHKESCRYSSCHQRGRTGSSSV